MLELEARGEGGFGHLQLLRRRFRGREAVLELVPRTCERPGNGVLGIADHPREDLGRGGEGAERREPTSGEPELHRCARGEGVTDRERPEERSDQVRAAPLVLLLVRLAVLVGTDRDVLRAVVGGELGAPERNCGRRPS